jgi:hypothetical protein
MRRNCTTTWGGFVSHILRTNWSRPSILPSFTAEQLPSQSYCSTPLGPYNPAHWCPVGGSPCGITLGCAIW